jgi:hypothetical protein
VLLGPQEVPHIELFIEQFLWAVTTYHVVVNAELPWNISFHTSLDYCAR